MAANRLTSSLTPLTVLFATLIFSYAPTLQFGSVSGFHIDISLLYIVLVGSIAYYALTLWDRRLFVWSHVAWRWLVLFQLFATASTMWSPNPLRAAATVGFGWLLVLLVAVLVAHKKELHDSLTHNEKWVRGSLLLGLVIGGWQLMGDALHVPSWATLLPAMYNGEVFGFARPTSFALEPQFFGSLLLIPYGVFLYRVLHGQSKGDVAWLIALTTMLLLTLSRGAVLGAIVITIILVAYFARQGTRLIRVGLALFISINIALLLVLTTATLRSGSAEDGTKSVKASIEHMTLGTIRFPTPTTTISVAPSPEPTYIQSSTDSRLSMSKLAQRLWETSPVIGVGIGGFGAAASSLSPEFTPSTIANNYYLEMLAELGIVGVALFIVFIATTVYELIRRRRWLFVALLSGVLAQWWFFSGNANVLHVWVLFGIAIGIGANSLKKH